MANSPNLTEQYRLRTAGSLPLALLALLICMASMPARAEPPVPAFSARYELLRNGKLIGEAEVDFSGDAQAWQLANRSQGTRGLARMAGFHEQSSASGSWEAGQPRPVRSHSEMRSRLGDASFSSSYDWAAGKVESVWDEGSATLALQAGTVDSATISLRLRAGLAAGENNWELPVVDEDEIELQRYAVNASERLDTGLGCLELIRVERLRDPTSSRVTRFWYAPSLGWAPVKVEHGKKGGSVLATRLVELTLAGQPVPAGPACAE